MDHHLLPPQSSRPNDFGKKGWPKIKGDLILYVGVQHLSNNKFVNSIGPLDIVFHT